jgi:hypothetical protein
MPPAAMDLLEAASARPFDAIKGIFPLSQMATLSDFGRKL